MLLLAPMEGLLDATLRDVLTRLGGMDRCTSEFIRITDTLLPERAFTRVVPELHNAGRTRAGVPVRPQLLGSDPVCMAENAARLRATERLADRVLGTRVIKVDAAPKLIAEIRTAVEKRDALRLQRAAHFLDYASGGLGAVTRAHPGWGVLGARIDLIPHQLRIAAIGAPTLVLDGSGRIGATRAGRRTQTGRAGASTK